MRFFYRLVEGVPLVPLMNTIMHRQDLFVPLGEDGKVGVVVLRAQDHSRDGGHVADTVAMQAIPAAKKAALTLMQLVDGSALQTVEVLRLDPGGKLDWEPDTRGLSLYVIALHALSGALCSAGDETVNLRTGEFWWIDDRGPTQVANNSADDLILLNVNLDIDK